MVGWTLNHGEKKRDYQYAVINENFQRIECHSCNRKGLRLCLLDRDREDFDPNINTKIGLEVDHRRSIQCLESHSR
jgi:hypothetical protein